MTSDMISHYRIGEKLVLGRSWPVVMAPGEAGMKADHLLKKNHIWLDRLQTILEIVQADATVELCEALVNVIGQDVQTLHPISIVGSAIGGRRILDTGMCQFTDCSCVAPGKAALRRLVPGQPHETEMLARGNVNLDGLRNQKAKHMLGVM